MGHSFLTRFVTIALFVGLAGTASAQESTQDVVEKPVNLSTVSIARAVADVQDRRPPQAAPVDPSTDPTAPPDPRKVRRALGGFMGAMAGLAAGSVIGGMTNTRGPGRIAWPTAGVSIGMVFGSLASR